MTIDEINDATGFANGSKFLDADEVRNYLTVANLSEMFMGDSKAAQAELDEMAATVIANGWYMSNA